MTAIPRIYLTGFMGSGKSTLGPRLAEALDYAFLDLDEEIEREAGRSIRKIFSEGGEETFRALEQRAFSRTQALDRVVVAVGGGALANQDHMREALRQGLVVYLSISEQTARRRLGSADVDRPLLDDPGVLGQLLSVRDPLYRLAHVVLETDDMGIDESADALLQAVRSYQEGGTHP